MKQVIKVRHFMAKCTDINCNRVKLEGVRADV